ncbi:MAG: NAD(P)/FAD-dependent oxidoreductase, partial [Cocleimonas sp.]
SFLSDNGHDVVVLDQFINPAAVGSGLVIQPVGFEILKKLEIADELLEKGACGYQMLGLETDSGRKVLDVSYGESGGENFGLGIHRSSIFDVLFRSAQQRKVNIEQGSKVVNSTIIEGLRYLELEDGKQIGPFELVVDASGVKSKLSPLRSKDLPFGAIWGTVDWPENTTLKYNQLEQRYRKASNMIGILPIGSLPNENKDKATLFWSIPSNDYNLWCKTDIEKWHAEAEALWPELTPFVRQITEHKQMTMARYSHGQLYKPYAERLVFIGDSAHRASPQLGQGANMALLDAYALSSALEQCSLKQYSLKDALRTYAKARRNHVMVYQAMSWAFTPMYQSHSKVLPLLRDWMLAPMSQIPPVAAILTSLVKGTMVDACKGLGK